MEETTITIKINGYEVSTKIEPGNDAGVWIRDFGELVRLIGVDGAYRKMYDKAKALKTK